MRIFLKIITYIAMVIFAVCLTIEESPTPIPYIVMIGCAIWILIYSRCVYDEDD